MTFQVVCAKGSTVIGKTRDAQLNHLQWRR